MTKIIRIVWAMRDTAGKDRRQLAEAMILSKDHQPGIAGIRRTGRQYQLYPGP